MRYLVTWTSPIVYRESEEGQVESVGVYGVEGSKPGAAAGELILEISRSWLNDQQLVHIYHTGSSVSTKMDMALS